MNIPDPNRPGPTPSPGDAAWTQPAERVLAELRSGPAGLTEAEAAHRLAAEGPNEVPAQGDRPGWRILATQFGSPLVLLLVAASFVSLALGQRADTAIILAMVALGGVLGWYQEYRSERSLRQLRKRLSRTADVLRDGSERRLPARELVRGDVVVLRLGTVLAADLRLFEAKDLATDESALTGESLPVAKQVAPSGGPDAPPQDQGSMAFLGTHVVQGYGRGVVVAVGADTQLGHTAALLLGRAGATQFQRGLHRFGSFLLRVTIGLSAVVFVVLGLIHGNWSEALLFAVALAVGIAPELLPVIVTVNLSRGATAMSRRQVLVKRLSAIEDLGNATVFCTDKTGTLTEGALQVSESIDADGVASAEPLAWARHCVDVDAQGRAILPMDQVVLDAARGLEPTAGPPPERLALLPFDFERRRMSVVLADPAGGRRLICKGATTELLAACERRAGAEGRSLPLDANELARLQALIAARQDAGERLLAVAQRPIEARDAYGPQDERALELIGFLVIRDSPKASARPALEALAALGVRVVVLTGDNERVAARVARELGLDDHRILGGAEIAALDDAGLRKAVRDTPIFSRITPAHKLRILEALRAEGQVVGFLGDGVNDAPALRAADVGVSFEGAVDVAKEAAAVILLQKDLSVLADGIREGRRTFVNTRSYIRATISSNFGNMLSVAGAALLLPFIPLLPAQILLLNLLSDVPMLAISRDRVAPSELTRPLQWNIPEIANYMYFFGTISSLADYATFALLLYGTQANVVLFRSAWFVESMLTEVVVIFLVRTARLGLRDLPSPTLVLAAAATVAGTLVFLHSPAAAWFELRPLPGPLMLGVLAIVAGYALLTELGKRVYDRFHEVKPAPVGP